MKKVLSLILALVMVLAMFTMVGAAEEPEATVEPAVVGTTEPAVEPAEEQPAAPVEEAPASPEASEAAEPTEEPAPEATETVTEPTPAAPVAEPTAEPTVEPADNGVMTASAPAPAASAPAPAASAPAPAASAPLTVTVTAEGNTTIDAQKAYEGWQAYNNGQKIDENWKNTNKGGYVKLTAETDPDVQVVWHIARAGGTKGIYTAVEQDGGLYLLGGPDLSSYADGCHYDLFVTAQAGETMSKAVNITIESKSATAPTPAPTATPEPEHESVIPGEMLDPSEDKDDYTKGVWLTVVNGSFGDNKKASVWVDFENPGTRTLPTKDLPTAKRTNGTFKGWYTEAPTEELESSKDGYSYWKTVAYNGEEVQPGQPVPKDVQVLYAAFTDKAADSDSDKLVTFYLDWNGIDGRWGHCLTCTRSYDQGKAQFTAQDALVVGLNYEADNGTTFSEDVSWDSLQKFWGGNNFNGYTFLGWSTTPEGEPVWADQTITNGASFYAQWTKDDSTSKDFAQNGRVDPAAGPLTGLRILGELSSSMTGSKHADKGAAFTLSLFRSPVRAEANDVTWTVDVVKAAASPVEVFKSEKETITVKAGETKKTKDGGIELKAVGLDLTITCAEGGEYSVTASAAATGKDNKTIVTDSPATVSFYHTAGAWVSKEAPTCVKSGTEAAQCTVCGKDLTRKVVPLEHQWKLEVTKAATCTTEGLKEDTCTRCGVTFEQYQSGADKKENPPDQPQVLPATGHTFKVMSTAGSVNGARLLNEQCEVCQAEETILCGDANGDGDVSIVDLYAIYSYVLGETNDMTKLLASDVNLDGATNIVDLYKVYSYVLGEVPSL